MKSEELKKVLENHRLWLKSDGKQGERADFTWEDLRVGAKFDDDGLDYVHSKFRHVEGEEDPLLNALNAAPSDDEPTRDEDLKDIREGFEGYQRGEFTSLDDIRRKHRG